MGSDRSSSATPSKAPLHNFTLPGGLRWGNQKFLRCMKVNSNGQNSAIERKPSQFGSSITNNSYFYNGSENNSVFGNNKNAHSRSENDDDYASYYSNYENNNSKRLKGEEGGDGIVAVREKVILDLKTAADKMKDVISRGGSFGDVAAEEGSQPWNLRSRREAYGGSGGAAGGKNSSLDVIKSNADALMVSPLRMVEGETTLRLRAGGVSVAAVAVAVAAPTCQKKERVKFSTTLTRREIEEDFIAMVRHRPPRRPRKRPKYIQKQLDTLFPGVWLTEITADMYKVSET